MDNTAAVAPEAAPSPVDAAEQAAIAALEKEYGDEGQAEQQQEPPKAEAEPAKEAKKEEPQLEKKAPIPYEELEKRHRQLNGALAEERAQRKALAERAENMRLLFEQMQQRQAQPQPPAKPEIPDINEDPIGHFAAKVAELEGKLAEKDKAIGQTREQFEAEQAQRQFWGAVQRSESEFKATQPDYEDAASHLEQARIRELEIMFPDDSEQAYQIAHQAGLRTPADLRLATLNQDRISVAQQAFRLGMNPAELYYKLAQQRGYQPKGQAPVAQKMITPVQAAKAGAAAAKSLSAGAGSGGKDGPLAIDDLAELYLTDPDRADKEFAKLRSAGLLN